MLSDGLKSTSFFVREMALKVEQQQVSLVIGIPCEDEATEKRLGLTPETVALLVEAGYRVLLETCAGAGIQYSDAYYAESGAEIVETHQEVFQADLILKIASPTLEEVEMMRPRTTVFSFLQIHKLSSAILALMSEKRINALAYELLNDHTGMSPFVTAISEIEGASSITLAAELLSNAHGGKGILLGGIPGVSPTEVVIVGAGVAGTMAAKAALALGALVKVFDNDISKLRTIRHELGYMVYTSTLQPNVLRNVFRSADVVIGSMQYVNKTHFYRISSDLVREMKNGSLIIDLRMAQGGCFETTMEACLPGYPPIFEKFGVLHFCELSLSSRVARTASIALSNIFISLFSSMTDSGGLEYLARFNRGFASGFYMYCGKMVNSYVGNHFNYPVHNIGLFLPGC
ncbi:MAG TPA: alanine dehydrogenase [Porphyromonadaceae bacterium]|jgi:alanine dehydrogenase|nr:alanine dehydrogenase [Porphyromonadaceae bacterium]HBK32847.1 alanine dehydrogenase [Porphyromonadaceae bacterium]HBL32827.1 alanine dehydrogenase [Porphyromonadaceae bacterium]